MIHHTDLVDFNDESIAGEYKKDSTVIRSVQETLVHLTELPAPFSDIICCDTSLTNIRAIVKIITYRYVWLSITTDMKLDKQLQL